jgi:hypothetical protein
VCVTSTLTPTDNWPGRRKGVRRRAEAISIRAIIRAVAKTAGKESVGERGREDARSVGETMREAVAVVLG